MEKSMLRWIVVLLLLLASQVKEVISIPLWRPYYTPATSSKGSLSSKEKKVPSQIRFRKFINNVASGVVEAGPRAIHHVLYWLTAADALQSVVRNQYTDIIGTVTSRPVEWHMVPSVYSKLFYFARLRPRLVYSVGALLRALQLCTPMGRILDPSIGVGAGINLCAILASSRWVKPLILGWTTTKYVWKWLGAKRVERAYLPITLSIKEWEEQKSKKASKYIKDGPD